MRIIFKRQVEWYSTQLSNSLLTAASWRLDMPRRQGRLYPSGGLCAKNLWYNCHPSQFFSYYIRGILRGANRFDTQSHKIIHWGVLQRTMLQRKNATTNSFINTIRMLQRTQMLQRKECYNERGGILSDDVARACAWRVGPSRCD
jgi:hypothetical protein